MDSLVRGDCCCGRTDCPFLSHSRRNLERVEADLQTAAQLGQALLIRHEAYIADSEAERRRMAAKIEELETDKSDLEERNARVVQENRDLLDQLEALNNAVADRDGHVKSLTAALLDTNNELARLTVLANRTESLERQVAQLERDQDQLQETVASTTEEKRSAIQRWRKAERTIANLQDQIERIEREAREERERHVEIVGRMERRRAVERELESAAGRLKGAAAAKTVGDGKGSHVVSHFVKDILQDNANLQLGIVELREMLLTSNDEVERLRTQLMVHQPLDEAPDPGIARTPTLSNELPLDMDEQHDSSQDSPPQERPSSQDRQDRESRDVQGPKEFHVHHHYHAARETTPSKDVMRSRTLQRRSSRKKRSAITPSHFAPPRALHTPRSSVSSLRPATPSSAATILSQTSVTIPNHKPRRSTHTVDSGPSSSSVPDTPYTHSRRTSSLFNRSIFSDAGQDSSRPTSPESNAPGSPLFSPMQMKAPTFKQHLKAAPSVEINPCFCNPHDRRPSLRIPEEDLDVPHTDSDIIPEEPEHDHENDGSMSAAATLAGTPDPSSILDMEQNNYSEDIYAHLHSQRPVIRRHNSHDSLLSVSGMDIHTLRSRPQQLLFAPNGPSPSYSLAGPSLSNMTAMATRPTLSGTRSSSRGLLEGMASAAAMERPRAEQKTGSIGQKVGGWWRGKWGSTPTPAPPTPAEAPTSTDAQPAAEPDNSANDAHEPVAEDASEQDKADKTTDTTGPQRTRSFKLRIPGVNQSGPIFGMRPEPKAPFKVVLQREEVDVDALSESLAEAAMFSPGGADRGSGASANGGMGGVGLGIAGSDAGVGPSAAAAGPVGSPGSHQSRGVTA